VRSYELTERGKILIAVIIAVVLLVLALVLAVKTYAKQDSMPPGNLDSAASDFPSSPPVEDPTEPPTMIPIEIPPKTSDNPPPNGNGGGSSPPETSLPIASSDPEDELQTNGQDEDDLPDNGLNPGNPPIGTVENNPPGIQDVNDPLDVQETNAPPNTGPTGGNPSEGTLSFLFSPAYQSELDTDTASLLGAFLNSPNNTRNSTIAVMTSKLSDNDSAALMAAVVQAFNVHGIPAQRIRHIENSSGTAPETFEVSLYFIPASGK